jgi:hypothetical protein
VFNLFHLLWTYPCNSNFSNILETYFIFIHQFLSHFTELKFQGYDNFTSSDENAWKSLVLTKSFPLVSHLRILIL